MEEEEGCAAAPAGTNNNGGKTGAKFPCCALVQRWRCTNPGGPRLRILHRKVDLQNGFTIEPDMVKLVVLSLSLCFSVLVRTRHRKSRFTA